MDIFLHGGLSVGKSLIRVVFHQGGPFQGDLSSWWSFSREVSYQGDLSLGWSFSGRSFLMVVFQ